MVRRIMTFGGILVAIVVLTMGAAMADRLGGAYRGPYEDEVRPKEATSTEVTADAGANAAEGAAEAGSGGSSESGEMGAGGAAPGEGSGEGEGGDTHSPASPPPPPNAGEAGTEGGDSGGGSGVTKPPTPSGGPGTIGGSGGVGTGARGKTAIVDTKAFWPFYFEYNKEAILDRILTERGAQSSPAPFCSSWFYSSAGEVRQITPVTPEQKSRVVMPVLIDALEHRSPWVRDAACIALGKLGTAEVVPHLALRVARETDLEIKQDALLALGLTRRAEALHPLLKALHHKDLRIRPYAALGLALLGREEAIEDLLAEYKTLWSARDDDQTAAVYAVALGHLIGDEHVDELAAPLRQDGRDILKIYICQALGNVGGENARRWLVRSSAKERGEVRAAVALALSKYSDKDSVRMLLGKDFAGSAHKMTRAFAQVSLGRVGVTMNAQDGARSQIRAALSASAEKPLKDSYAAMFATIGLGLMRDAGANDFFRTELMSDKQTRFASENYSAMAMSMGLMGDRRSMVSLRGIVRKGRDPDFQGYAALALGVLGDSDSKELLSDLITDPRERSEVQRPACWGLGLLGDRTDVPVLIDALKVDGADKHTVRGSAAMALGLIGDQAALAPLVKMATEDANSSNRAFAIVALGCLVDPTVLPRLPRLFENIHYRAEVNICRDALRNL